MKAEFKNAQIEVGSVFYLYGNCKRTFEVFCNFVASKLKNVRLYYCTMAEYEKSCNLSQNDLFDNRICCYCIRGVEDKHTAQIEQLPCSNNIFILESGNYAKSKKITDTLVKSRNIQAIASFDNNLTYASLCNLIIPKLSPDIYAEIVRIIGETDENLLSLFKKISLLIDRGNAVDLREYISYKRSFLDDVDFIALTRYALQTSIKQNILQQKYGDTHFNLQNKIHFLLDAEIKQKQKFNQSPNNLCSNPHALQCLQQNRWKYTATYHNDRHTPASACTRQAISFDRLIRPC